MKIKILKSSIQIPAYILPLCFLVGLSFLAFYDNGIASVDQKQVQPTQMHLKKNHKLEFVRLAGYDYVRPLLYVDDVYESNDLFGLKQRIKILIEDYKKKGEISAASVYINVFSKGWISINNEESYHPGHLNMIPMMMAYLKMSEMEPEVLGRKFDFAHGTSITSNKLSLSFPSIEAGQNYSVKELLYYMVSYSDKNAYNLLANNVDDSILENLYTDLGIPVENLKDPDYTISPKEYSRFLRVLYNSTYLNVLDSEYALKLLSNSGSKKGLKTNFPANTKMIHKTGDFLQGNEYELHESGIVYLDSIPCLLTVMTKGNEVKNLPKVISNISKLTYSSIIRP